jgi:geranylgeranyl pyrophosphate synthase
MTTATDAGPDLSFRQAVLDVLAGWVGDLPASLRPLVRPLVEHPGKCLRSHLVEVCGRFGTPERDRLVRLGALVELVHLASLLHDDVIDQAATRRGQPTAHTVAGGEMAVLAGMACFALAGQEAAELGSMVSGAVSATVAELSYGELLDVERAFDTTLAIADYLELVGRKTAALFRLCCVLGAAEAGVDGRRLESLAAFGRELGVTFQVLDDCLDLRTSSTDKPVGTDHLLGLFGLPTLCALGNGGSAELSTLLLSPALDLHDLPRVRSLIVAAGGVEAALRLARQRYNDAVTALGELGGSGPSIALLRTGEAVWRPWT